MTWFADLNLRTGTPVCVEYGWDNESGAVIEDIWIKGDDDDSEFPLATREYERLERMLSERGDPRVNDSCFDYDDFPDS